VFLVPLVGFFDQSLVKLPFLTPDLSPATNRIAFLPGSKAKMTRPTSVRPESEFLHVCVLRILERVYFGSSQRRPILPQRNERREEFVLNRRGQLIELGFEFGMEVSVSTHKAIMPYRA
jgi:hypothetical protein